MKKLLFLLLCLHAGVAFGGGKTGGAYAPSTSSSSSGGSYEPKPEKLFVFRVFGKKIKVTESNLHQLPHIAQAEYYSEGAALSRCQREKWEYERDELNKPWYKRGFTIHTAIAAAPILFTLYREYKNWSKEQQAKRQLEAMLGAQKAQSLAQKIEELKKGRLDDAKKAEIEVLQQKYDRVAQKIQQGKGVSNAANKEQTQQILARFGRRRAAV